MHEKFQAPQTEHTWSLVPLPKNKHAIGCKWVFKLKRNLDGTIARNKARLVAKGYLHEECTGGFSRHIHSSCQVAHSLNYYVYGTLLQLASQTTGHFQYLLTWHLRGRGLHDSTSRLCLFSSIASCVQIT